MLNEDAACRLEVRVCRQKNWHVVVLVDVWV